MLRLAAATMTSGSDAVIEEGTAPMATEAASRQGRKGRYKIFLGMAAGVGKTYRMLQEGRSEAEAGRDVVIGYLEPHDRPETTAQARGLEVVPRRRSPTADTTLEEMDLSGDHRAATRSWR